MLKLLCFHFPQHWRQRKSQCHPDQRQPRQEASLCESDLYNLVLFMAVLSISHAASAEGSCPAGQYPQNGQGWQSCVPIPGYGSGSSGLPRPSARWVSRWQAIATDTPKGILGTSVDRISQEDAERYALDQHAGKGGTNCTIRITNENGCIAMVVGDKVLNTNDGETRALAEQKGLDMCAKDDTHCMVYYSSCSPPLKVQ